jgi:hypothetical protein
MGVRLDNVSDVVRYHKPTEEQIVQHEKLAVAAENFLRVILEQCPPCADTSAAIRLVREAKMTASAAVALNGMV